VNGYPEHFAFQGCVPVVVHGPSTYSRNKPQVARTTLATPKTAKPESDIYRLAVCANSRTYRGGGLRLDNRTGSYGDEAPSE